MLSPDQIKLRSRDREISTLKTQNAKLIQRNLDGIDAIILALECLKIHLPFSLAVKINMQINELRNIKG